MSECSSDVFDNIERATWEGGVPVMLSLSPMSLSSATMPAPVHKIIPRHSYLHIALQEEVRTLHQYAPVSFSGKMLQNSEGNGLVTNASIEEDDDVNGDGDGNRDTEGEANKSQFLDTKNQITKPSSGDSDKDGQKVDSPYPICWFEDIETGTPLRWYLFIGLIYDLIRIRKSSNCQESFKQFLLPWKIRVHFTSYPEYLLPLCTLGKDDVMHSIFQHYLNSLKQSIYLQHNSSRIAKNMNKQSHVDLWEAIVTNQWEPSFRRISMELNGNKNGNDLIMNNVPIRILVDGKPAFSRPCKQLTSEGKRLTVGYVLRECLPTLFEKKFHCCIQGVDVGFDHPVDEIWRAFRHPDRFLYILVVFEV